MYISDISGIDFVLGTFIQGLLGLGELKVNEAVIGTVIWFVMAILLLLPAGGMTWIAMKFNKSISKSNKIICLCGEEYSSTTLQDMILNCGVQLQKENDK